jgi:hypothetical protein
MPLGRALRAWIPLAVALSLFSAMLYAVVQQDLRSGANDPQIDMAESAAARLDAEADPQALIANTKVDLAHSLAPYLIIVDDAGKPVAAGATLHGATLVPPSGVFEHVRAGTQSRITWQPEPGVRSAIVVSRYAHGFVVAGRSLRVVEEREDAELLLIAVAWVATLVATAVACLLVAWWPALGD